jgi:hypothetical protein
LLVGAPTWNGKKTGGFIEHEQVIVLVHQRNALGIAIISF